MLASTFLSHLDATLRPMTHGAFPAMAHYSHPKCYLRDRGDCSTKITREHWLSDALDKRMRAWGDGELNSTGLKMVPEGHSIALPASSLGSLMLCDHHNSILSPLDSAACELYDSLEKIRIHLDAGGPDPGPLQVDGAQLERWLLKVLVGALESKSTTNLSGMTLGTFPFARLLTDPAAEWPGMAGLYIDGRHGLEYTPSAMSLKGWVNLETGSLEGMKLYFCGLPLVVLLVDPPPVPWLFYRPGRIEFSQQDKLRSVELGWTDERGPELVRYNVGGRMDRVSWLKPSTPMPKRP